MSIYTQNTELKVNNKGCELSKHYFYRAQAAGTHNIL